MNISIISEEFIDLQEINVSKKVCPHIIIFLHQVFWSCPNAHQVWVQNMDNIHIVAWVQHFRPKLHDAELEGQYAKERTAGKISAMRFFSILYLCGNLGLLLLPRSEGYEVETNETCLSRMVCFVFGGCRTFQSTIHGLMWTQQGVEISF